MERIELTYPATASLPNHAQAGVVASGDLEALYEPTAGNELQVKIVSNAEGSEPRWRLLLDRLSQLEKLPAGILELHDSGATPGVARLRIEQAFEEANHE